MNGNRYTMLCLAIFLIASSFISACMPAPEVTPTAGPLSLTAAAESTKVVETQSALLAGIYDAGTATAIMQQALGLPTNTLAPTSTSTPEVQYHTQVPSPTTTPTPIAKVVKNYCAGAGGQWFSEVNDGLQFAGFFERTKLMTTGLPMQAYYGQTSNTGINQYTYKDTVFIIENTRETWNDGGMTQLIGCEDDNGQLHIYMAERKNDSFNKVSYVIWTANGPVGYTHDDGDPGTWEGAPSGDTIAYIEVFANTVPGDLKTHYNMIVQLMSGPAPMPFENGVITVIWHKPE